MKWRDVEAGMSLQINGQTWKVLGRDGDAVTMLHTTLGERTGSPPPDGDVEPVVEPEKPEPYRFTPEQLARTDRAVKAASEKMVDPDLRRLQDFAKDEGFRTEEMQGLDIQQLRDLIAKRRAEKVAKDNGVPVREVEDAHIRLTLGATLIAELRTGEPPAVTELDKMDLQTLRNHLHFFHQTYPDDGMTLDELKLIHEEAQEHERHAHTVPF